MRLLLIRHGQTPSNVESLLDTRIPGPGLTELGLAQAGAVPAALAGERVDAIYASTQVRTQITAAPLAAERGLDVGIRAGIREVESGDYEGLNDRASIDAYLAALFTWVGGDLDFRLAGGESGAEVVARFSGVVQESYDAGHPAVAIFAHGAVIRLWAGLLADNLDVDYIRARPLDNTGIVVMEGSPDAGWSAVTYMGQAIGGPSLDDADGAGPAGEPAGERTAHRTGDTA